MDNFNLELLRNFLVVSRMQSFSKASSYLYVDQSTISKQIKQLESQFDIKLFVRTAQGVQLTVDGRRFAEQARQLMADYQRLGGQTTIGWNQLRIGIFDNIAVAFCQPFLMKHFADLREAKISDEGRALVSLFNQGKLDVIMVNGSLQAEITGHFVADKLADEDMMVLAGRHSSLGLHEGMKMADLKGQKLLVAPDYCPVSQQIMQSRQLFSELHQIDYTETMIQLVANSDYLTILPAGMVKQLMAEAPSLSGAVLTDLPRRTVTIFARERDVLDKVSQEL